MARALTRPLTGLERVWLVSDRLWPPFVNQLVVEGEGAPDPDAWRRAVDAVLPAWPGARARLHGVLAATRWVADGPAPAVTVAEAWDGVGPAPFTRRPLDPWEGPIVEVVVGPSFVALRTHHAAFDGRAAWALAEDLGAALRGEPVRGAAFDGVTDTTLAGPGPLAAEPAADAWLPLGPAADADPDDTTWVRRSLGPPGGRVLPRALVALARTLPRGPDRAFLRVSVPVDLRRHADDVRAAANLTGFVRVEVDADTTPAGAEAALARALAAREELGPVRTADKLRAVPLTWMEIAGRAAAHRAVRSGRAATSATVSNLGRQDPGVFAHAGFRPRRLFWIPPAGPGTPLFVTLTGHPGGVEVCAGAPVALAGGGRLEALVAGVAEELGSPSR